MADFKIYVSDLKKTIYFLHNIYIIIPSPEETRQKKGKKMDKNVGQIPHCNLSITDSWSEFLLFPKTFELKKPPKHKNKISIPSPKQFTNIHAGA